MAVTDEVRRAIVEAHLKRRAGRMKPLPDIGRFADDLTKRAYREIPSKAWREKIEALIAHRDCLDPKARRQLAASLRAAACWLQEHAARLTDEE
jgi:hypothetical protein